MNRRFCVFGLTLVSALHAAELRPETLSAWDRYVQSADAAMQARLRPGNPVLWVDEVPGRRRQLHAGEILVTSVESKTSSFWTDPSLDWRRVLSKCHPR